MGAMDLFNHYKFYHFFSICFGLGCGLMLYRPYYSTVLPSIICVFCTVGFEFLGAACGLPAHTKKCKGAPYDRRDVIWGYCFAFLVTILHLRSYHVYTMSCGWGITIFAIRGAKRKYSALWEKWKYYD